MAYNLGSGGSVNAPYTHEFFRFVDPVGSTQVRRTVLRLVSGGSPGLPVQVVCRRTATTA